MTVHPDEMNVWERMKHDELVHDARLEQTQLEADTAYRFGWPKPDPVPADAEHTGDESCLICEGCESEFIDGSYTNCGCCECNDEERRRREENPEEDEEY